MSKKIITYLFLMHIIVSINAQKFTAKDLLGTWETSVIKNGYSCTMSYVFKPNGTAETNVSCDGSIQNVELKGTYYYKSTSTAEILSELINGQTYNGQIIWVNVDSMIYVTIKNGDIKTTGEKLYYKRVKVINVSDYKPPLNIEVTEYFTSTWRRCEKQDAAFYRIVKYKDF